MAKFLYSDWLFTFLETHLFFLFEWDEGNLQKNEKKHGVTVGQIESCFLDKRILPLGIQTEPEVHEDRYGVIAKDDQGSILFICFTLRDEKVRVVSARTANKREKAYYEKN